MSIRTQELFRAPEFNVNHWVDANGNKAKAINLSDLESKFKVLFCFQSWCRGCHSKGFPNLKTMVDALEGNDKVVFLAIQTVFEGYEINTFDKMLATQKQYDLKIPFGHDAGKDDKSQSNILTNYKTGGTPWIIFIDTHNNVVYSDFHLYTSSAIDFLETIR